MLSRLATMFTPSLWNESLLRLPGSAAALPAKAVLCTLQGASRKVVRVLAVYEVVFIDAGPGDFQPLDALWIFQAAHVTLGPDGFR